MIIILGFLLICLMLYGLGGLLGLFAIGVKGTPAAAKALRAGYAKGKAARKHQTGWSLELKSRFGCVFS